MRIRERQAVTRSDGDESVSGIHRRAQAKLSGVFGAKKKVQVGIQAGIPFLPAMLPVRFGEIARVVAEDFHRFGAISLGLRIKNEIGLAGRRKSGVLGGRRSRLGTLIHRRDGRSSGKPRPLASMTPSFRRDASGDAEKCVLVGIPTKNEFCMNRRV